MTSTASSCPKPVLAAFRTGAGYLGLSHDLVCKIVQGRDYQILQRMFSHKDMPDLVKRLLKAAPEQAETLIELAAYDSATFKDGCNWRETEKQLKAFIKVTETYRARLKKLDWVPVQEKSDIATDLALTGRSIRVERLIANLDDHLSALTKLCGLPRPTKGVINWGASRPNAILKVGLLRNAAPRVPKALIADLVNIAENLSDEQMLTEDDF